MSDETWALTHLGQMPLDTRMKNSDKNLIMYSWESVSDWENTELLELPGSSSRKGNLHPLTASSHWLLTRRAGAGQVPWESTLDLETQAGVEERTARGRARCSAGFPSTLAGKKGLTHCRRQNADPAASGEGRSETLRVHRGGAGIDNGPGPARTCNLRQAARPQDPGLPLIRATEPPLSRHHTPSPSPS